MKATLILATLSILSTTYGAEADHYSEKEVEIVDISDHVNKKANEFLEVAVNDLNKKGTCSDDKESELKLYEELAKYFNNHSKGKLVIDLLHNKEISKRSTKLDNSVYGDWSIFNGFLLGRKKAAQSPLALSPLIQIGDVQIGIDKLEHMFGMGSRYFKSYYLKKKKLRKVLKVGIFKEKTILGGNFLATGVFSYGDLSANFNGMRFWNHILQKRDDVLGKQYNIGPYIKCSNELKWEVVKNNKIDFKNYVDLSMDESINCSKFANKGGVKRFNKSLKSLSAKYEMNLTCPMNRNSLQQMKEKYNVTPQKEKKPISHWIINDEGHEKVSYFNEF